jgi:hypothetical protein
MTREEFIGYLESKNIDFELGPSGMIVVTHKDDVDLGREVDEIPSGVEFRNTGQVKGYWVKVVNSNVIFNNQGQWGSEARVWLPDADKIYPGVKFTNGGTCRLKVLERPPNKADILFRNWVCNIKGVDPNRLLNSMISKGLFI